MKNTIPSKFVTASVIAVAGLLLSTAATQASLFHVQIDTAALNLPPASANAPFSLDFQFNDGGVLGNNTATISNFTYGGGTATGSAFTLGGALGDIGSTVTLDNSSAFQELFQTFTPGAILGFDVSLTQFVDGFTPDSFVVGILDNALLNIPTTGIGNSIFHGDIDSTSPITITQANFGSGTGDYAGLTAVPEPGTAFFGFTMLGAIGAARRRRS